MLTRKVILSFSKYKEINLLDKIKVEGDDFFYYFPYNLRLVCNHLSKMIKIYDFKKFKTFKVNLNEEEFRLYYDKYSSSFKFKGVQLLNEKQFKESTISSEVLFSYELHRTTCSICKTVYQPKQIKKRKKLSHSEQLQLAKYIGSKAVNKSIMKEFDLSKEAIRKFKKKLNQPQLPRQLKRPYQPTSITEYEQDSILNYNDLNPFHSSKRIKINLNLKCHHRTISNMLKKKRN